MRFRLSVEWLEDRLAPSTFVVSRTADDANSGSLRWAITQANNTPGLDTISFNIAGSGVHTIVPQSGLPAITSPLLLDGTSQPGYSGAPLIELNGSQAGNVDGLDVSAGSSTIKGLVINRFSGDGIVLYNGGGNLIAGNYLGTDPTGTTAEGNGVLDVLVNSANNTIGGTSAGAGNVLSGSGQVGLQFFGTGATGNVVQGNFIGTNPIGTAAVANTGDGVLINGQASGNTIGGTTAGAGNVISGNKGIGVQIADPGTKNNVVQGNSIGTQSGGSVQLANGSDGVLINNGATNNTVGGTASGARNILSANTYHGVQVADPGTSGNVIQGNYIGTNAAGTAALPNGSDGVLVNNQATLTTIAGNVLSGNTYQGVQIADAKTTGTTVQGNWIGTDAGGTQALGNGDRGVLISNGATNSTIGGSAGQGNVIAFNRNGGVAIFDATSTGHTIRANSIFSNGGPGIDLAGDAVTINDARDADTGPNNLQNFPVLLSASPGPTTPVSGTLDSTPGQTFTLDFYASPQPGLLYFGDGTRYLGSATVSTDATGKALFSVTLTAATSTGDWLSATATDSAGNTSEFSEARRLPAAPVALDPTSWTPLGPAPVTGTFGQAENALASGRVNVAAPDPSNVNVMYLAGDGGGVWKTRDWLDPNPTWTPLTDDQPSLSISEHCLVVFPGNTQVLYAAANRPAGGILKSTDGGATWSYLAGSTFQWAYFGAIVVDPSNPSTVYVAEDDGGPAGGVYKSTDGGQTWQNLTAGTVVGAASDLAMDPTNPQVFYAGFWDTAGNGAGNGVWKSSDGGATWTLLSNGVPSGPSAGFIRLAVAPSAPQTVYATVLDSGNSEPGRYRTSDGGGTWSKLTGLPGPEETRTGHVMLAVDPKDPNLVWANGDHAVYYSSDGGSHWTGPVFGEDPVGGYFDAAGALVLVGDRGIHRSPDRGTTWTPTKQGNLQVTEFYDTTLDPTDPNFVYGIAQDHTAVIQFTGGPVWTYLAVAPHDQAGAGASETGKLLVDPTNPSRLYQFAPVDTYSFILRSDDGGASWAEKGTGIDTSPNGFGLAYTSQRAFVMDPSNPSRLIVCTDRVYETTNGADSWTAISGALSPGQFITAVAIAPSAGSTLYASTADGRFFTTSNDGGTWTEIDQGLPGGSAYAIVVDPANPLHVVATVAGGVWMSADGGASWSNHSGDLPAAYGTTSLVVDWRFKVPMLYAGTVRGVYRSTDQGVTWVPFAQGLPHANITDLEFLPNRDILAASTYGRGVWEIQVPGPATQLALTLPARTTAGAAFSVTVTALDDAGKAAIGYPGRVHFSTSDTAGGHTLPGDYTFTPGDAGSHTFSSAVTLVTAGSQTLSVQDTGSGSIAGSASVTVAPSAADRLAFLVQPGDTPAGSAITPAVQVQVLDRFGNLISSDNSDQVMLSVAGSTATATVSGGIATFGNLVLTTAGTYTLAASASGLSGASSNSFTVQPLAADHLAYLVQPGSSVAGGTLSPAVQVEVLDAYGNLLTSDNSDQVTLSLGSNPAGGTLSGTTTRTSSGGITTFADLSIDTPGSGYTLAAAATGLAGVASDPFDVHFPGADHLGFLVQPGDGIAGQALSPSVQVEVLDQFGHLVSGDNSDQITVSVAGGTTTVTVSGGIATFGNLVLTAAGSYSLSARAGSLGGASSGNFTISPAAADHLAFGVQPGSTTAGQALSPAVSVRILDAYGNLVTGDTDPVTLSVAGGPGDFTADSTLTENASGGIATFANLALDGAGDYTLAAARGGLSGTVSAGFTVRPAGADHLAFAVQPADTTAGSALHPAVKVDILDAFGNVLVGDNSDRVKLAVASGPGDFSGSTTTVTASAGVASFTSLVLTAAGSYTLSAGSAGLAPVDSHAFTVRPGSADHLAFRVEPGDTTAGAAINPAVQVQLLDRYDNLLANSSDPVTLSVASGPGGFAPGSTTTVNSSSGVATFDHLELDKAGTYSLAAGEGLLTATTTSFTVNPAAADHLAFAVGPGDGVAGASLGVVVQVLDRFGNLQTADSSDQVTLSVVSGPGNVTTTAPVSNGVAAFANLVLTAAGTYTLGVTGTGDLGGADSSAFTIGPAAADHLAFRVPPADAIAGQPLTPAVQVAVFDRFGNPVPSDNTDRVTLSIATGPGAFSGASTTAATVSSGVATFPTLILTTAGTYTLAAGGLSSAISPSFHVSAAAADHLAFLVQPGRVTAGQVLSPPLQVAIEDAFGNVVGSDTSTVSLALAGNPAGVGLGGTLGVPAANGIATFSDLTLSAGGSFMLQASDGSLAGSTSSAFEVDQLLLSSTTVREFRPTGTSVGTLGVLGGSGHTFHYAIVGSAPFTISGNRLLSADAFDFTAKSRYSVRVRASDETGHILDQVFTISVLDDPRLTRSGKTLTVKGTAGKDSFSFTPGVVRDSLTLNGVQLAADTTSVSKVVFQGGGGSDSVTLTGSSGSDTFTGQKGSSTLAGKGYSITVQGFALVKVNGSAGADKGLLLDSKGDDHFAGFKDTGTLSGAGYSIVIASLEDVTLNGKAGGKNTLRLAQLAYKLHQSGVWIAS